MFEKHAALFYIKNFRTMERNYNFYFYPSLFCAIWFLLTSYAWTYFANVFISFPFGILSLYLWNQGRKKDNRKNRYKPVGWILFAGFSVSLITLIILLSTN